MAEIEFRLPSAVPYAYVNVKASEAELGADGLLANPEMLARVYANYVMAFSSAEREALDAYGKPQEAPSEPPSASVDQEAEASETDPQADAESLIKSELGATKIGEEPAPWEEKAEATEPKPWEKKAAPKAATVEW
jgi:hypothetical protein